VKGGEFTIKLDSVLVSDAFGSYMEFVVEGIYVASSACVNIPLARQRFTCRLASCVPWGVVIVRALDSEMPSDSAFRQSET
jgi:hypothetical protein